jgi:D-glycero-D-manno-heptose 1,7-bisphosphate phosphatase
MTKKAIFLDRDGTLIIEKNYLHKPEEVQIEHTVIPALFKLQKNGYLLFIVTNQAGIGRGYYTQEDFERVQSHLINEFKKHKITIAKTYHCPHHPSEGKGKYLKDCNDRKPKPGMILRACAEFKISPQNTFMIGDTPSDIQAGKNAGCKTILVKTGHAKQINPETLPVTPDFIATSLEDAVDHFILKDLP